MGVCARLAAVVVGVTLAGTGVPVFAATGQGNRERAEELYEDGATAYRAGRYESAARLWTFAYDDLADDPALEGPRHVLGFNLAQAHVKAFADDRDPERLARARILTEAYIEWLERPGYAMGSAERRDYLRSKDLLVKIGKLESGEAEDPLAEVQVDEPERPHDGDGLLIAGAGTLGGAALLGAIAGGLHSRADQLRREADQAVSEREFFDANERATHNHQAFVATAVMSAISAATGVGLLVGGALRKQNAVEVRPKLSRTYAGGMLRVRF